MLADWSHLFGKIGTVKEKEEAVLNFLRASSYTKNQ